MRSSATLGCHAGSVAAASGRIAGDVQREACPAELRSARASGSAIGSATGSGSGRFRGRPRFLLGATSSTGGGSRDAIGARCAGCETVAGSGRLLRRLETGDEEAARVGALSTRRSILIASPGSVGAWAGSTAGVSSLTAGSAATGTGSAFSRATTEASLEAPGRGLP